MSIMRKAAGVFAGVALLAVGSLVYGPTATAVSNPRCDTWREFRSEKTPYAAVGYRADRGTGNPTYVGLGACEAHNTFNWGYGVDAGYTDNPYAGKVASVSFGSSGPDGTASTVVQVAPGGWCSTGPALVGRIYQNIVNPNYICL